MEMTNFEYNLLFLFKICADCGSFSKASQELHVKQPAISYNIKKLEDLLNIKLFDRTKFGIELTEEGKVLYDYIKEANNNIVSGLTVLDEISKKEITQLNVGVALNLAVVYLPNVIKKINKLFPNVKVILKVQREEDMIESLQEKKLDIVIFNSSKNITIKGVKIKRVKNNEVVCVGNKEFKNLLEGNTKTGLQIPLILPCDDSVIGQNISVKLDIHNISLKNTIKCSSAILAKELLLHGLGIGYINKASIVNELENNELYILDNESNLDVYSINIATQLRNNNIVIEEFKKFFIEEVNK